MSQPAVAAPAPLPFELVYSDGEPLETEWHTWQFPLGRELIRQVMAEQSRSDYFVGGDMFVYYSVEQAREVARRGRSNVRGPDLFWVGGVAPAPLRKAWVSWQEGGRLPDLIVELLSPSTAEIDRNEKKALYAEVFRTREYYLYEPETRTLEGFRLIGRTYRPIAPGAEGRLWSEQLRVSFGPWHGTYKGQEADWLRLFRPDGSLVPTEAEAERHCAEAERQRAEAERQRAEAAETELARLRALLAEREAAPPPPPASPGRE